MKNAGMEKSPQSRRGWREAGLLLLVISPLFYLLIVYGLPVPQDRGYHLFADTRTCFGLKNFANIASNLAFFVTGVAGVLWCRRNPGAGASGSWTVFFTGVALVFFGSGYYHYAPGDHSLAWDRLPMTVAFMGLFTALLCEHLDGPATEKKLLIGTLATGIASVLWWRISDDLRLYIWVQLTPLLVIPYVIAVFPARYTHRHYLLYGVGFYALAKIAEYYDYGVYALSAGMISGHTLKHLLAAMAAVCVLLMLIRRRQSRTPVASSQ